MQHKISNKKDIAQTLRFFVLFNKYLLKNVFLYVYGVFLPFLFSALMFWWYVKHTTITIFPALTMSMLLPCCFTLMFIVSIAVSEWNNTIMLKRLYSFNFKKKILILAIYLTLFLYMHILLVFNYLILMLISAIAFKSGWGFNNSLVYSVAYISFGSFGYCLAAWLTTFLSYWIVGFSSISIGFLVAIFLKKPTIVQSIMFIIFLIQILFSDFLWRPSAQQQWYEAINIISYIASPTKYGVWSLYFGCSNFNVTNFVNFSVLYKIVVSFKNIYECLFPGIAFTTLLIFINYRFFKINTRGV